MSNGQFIIFAHCKSWKHVNLIIDIGNTAVKLAAMEGDTVLDSLVDSSADFEQGSAFVEKYRQLPCIAASVRHDSHAVWTRVCSLLPHALVLTHDTELPIKNLYATPATLGKDRLAAAVGAAHLYPHQNVLVVDAGTAITYELVSSRGEYLGGNISPGISLRFKSLHQFTGRLPLCHLTEVYADMGTDTPSAIVAGVLNGAVYEVEANVEQFSLKYSNLKVIFTGGDAYFFAKRVKKAIFVAPDLVLIGLNRILEHHAATN